MGWMTMLLAVGATARITRLVGRDTITFFFRDWLAAQVEDAKEKSSKTKVSMKERIFTFVEDMVACPWCLSVLVSVPVAVAAWIVGDTWWFLVPALALTASQVTGLVSMKEA